MSSSQLFQIVNFAALIGWIILGGSILFKRPFWRDVIAGQVWPTALSIIYTCLIIFFFAKLDGGFDTLENVQKLFTSPWAALAGWVHYLAFDLLTGAYLSRRVLEDGLPRLVLVVILPLTFLFGPIGYLAYQVTRLTLRKVSAAA